VALNYAKLKDWKEPPLQHSYGARDSILYALGVGLGADPLDEEQLRFVYEKGLKALPTMATVLASPFGWLYRAGAGVTKVKAVHGEQGFRMHRPLPAAGDIVGELAVTDIVDKGKDKGAIVYFERSLRERASGDLLCTLTATMFCRADGGFNGPPGAAREPQAMPRRAPDAVCDLPTLPQAALLFRLNGDVNPLHAEPAVARAAGFPQPVLHGLCAYGVVGHALLRTCCGYDPARLVAMHARFSAPVYPGESIRTEMWREGGEVMFRARVPGRGTVVLDNGRAEISD
jgi:acyl dehydratase